MASTGESPGSPVRRSPGENEHLGTTVVRAVADALDTDVDEFAVELNDTLDPDALDRLFAPRPDGTPRVGGTVSFRFRDCAITVDGDQTVTVTRDETA